MAIRHIKDLQGRESRVFATSCPDDERKSSDNPRQAEGCRGSPGFRNARRGQAPYSSLDRPDAGGSRSLIALSGEESEGGVETPIEPHVLTISANDCPEQTPLCASPTGQSIQTFLQQYLIGLGTSWPRSRPYLGRYQGLWRCGVPDSPRLITTTPAIWLSGLCQIRRDQAGNRPSGSLLMAFQKLLAQAFVLEHSG